MASTKHIPIEISARHVHLTEADWTKLFGRAAIKIERPISQHPQFAARQRVTLSGPRGQIKRVAIVGPFRDYTQVELALTDAHRLGVKAPTRESGRLTGAGRVTIRGRRGQISCSAAIVQQRHLHLNPTEANHLGLRRRKETALTIAGARGGRLDHVVIRIHPDYTRRLHLDTDEANALGVRPGMTAKLSE